MSKISDYSKGNVISTTLRGAAFPVPAAVYVALGTSDITGANVTANEVQVAAFPAYVREDAAAGAAIATGWTANSGGVSSNAKVITFPANNGAGPVTVTSIGLYDAATGGNLLYDAMLTTPKTLQIGDVLSFAIGTLTVTIA
jgi:hypothetical protein